MAIESMHEFRLSKVELEQYHRDGFLGPLTLCNQAEAENIQRKVVTEILSRPGPNTCNEEGVPDIHSCRHLDNPEILRFCTQTAILGRVASILGEDITLFLTRFWVKKPFSGVIPWHQDSTYWHIYPKVAVSAWIALTEANEMNGGLKFIPGSHLASLPEVPSYEGMRFDLILCKRKGLKIS